MNGRCYLASPLGFTAAGRHYHEHVYLPALRGVVTVVELGAPVNLQVQSFISESGGEIVGTLEELTAALARAGGEA